jgi:hypothetical protein
VCCMVSNRHIAHMQQMIESVKSTSAHVHASRAEMVRACVQGKQSASHTQEWVHVSCVRSPYIEVGG